MRVRVDELVASIRHKARLDDVAVVGPLVWYPASEVGHPDMGGDVWAIFISTSRNVAGRPKFFCHMVTLGTVGDELPDWMAGVDCVFSIKRTSDLTRAEALERRREIATRLRAIFADVLLFDDELEYARFCAARWPGEKVEGLTAKIAKEREINHG